MTASEPATEVDLGDFEGKPVHISSVAVTNAGDGLSAALAVDPQILHQGDRGAILLEYEVAKVRFDPVKDTNGLNRVHILKAHTGTLVDLDEVNDRLEAQRRRIDEAKGELQLPFDDEGASDGEPQPIGSVLDDALDLAQQADDDLDSWAKPALLDEAKRLNIPGRSQMNAVELRDEIRNRREENGDDDG